MRTSLRGLVVPRPWIRRSLLGMAIGLAAVAGPMRAQDSAQARPPPAAALDSLPFFVGERLAYRVHIDRYGADGQVVMRVDTPQVLRGSRTWVLHSNVRARVGLITAVEASESWLDPVRLTALRYHSHERHFLKSHDEQVDIDAAAHAWTSSDGTHGVTATEAPLDELSFIYVLRMMAFTADSSTHYTRHYDVARNPIVVRLLDRRSVTTAAGTFRTLLVEMRVQDPQRYHGEGVIRLDFTDDDRRLPVRIESVVPDVGRTLMTLESHNHTMAGHVVVVR